MVYRFPEGLGRPDGRDGKEANPMKTLWNVLKSAHREEKGAEGLEKLLIVAAIVLPLLGLLIYFRDYINEWVGEETESMRGDADSFEDPDF